MLERWEAGPEETPHSHPGDDMTVVVEGKMTIRFFNSSTSGLVPDGEQLTLSSRETGSIKAGRIHDARYLETCKPVYVHDKVCGFIAGG